MNEFEIWIDIVYGDEVMCTLFGRLHMPNRPIVGECISFHQDKSSSYEFKVQRSPPDFLQVNIVSAEIDEIGHYAVKKENAVIFNTSIRCNAIVVGSLECAKQIIKFLSSQFGFEIDPYGINKFSG